MDATVATFRQVAPAADFWSLRVVESLNEMLNVRDDVLLPVSTVEDAGAMVTVLHQGGLGYAATSDLTAGGLREAARRAQDWAGSSAGRMVADFGSAGLRPDTPPTGRYESPVRLPWSHMTLADKIALLRDLCSRFGNDSRIVERVAGLWYRRSRALQVTSDGGEVDQTDTSVVPAITAAANQGSETVVRSFGGMRGYCRQGGLELIDELGVRDAPAQVAEEALQLLAAPDCPTGTMDVVLAPDQMILQIHESIGHPLELDRILGDERNYAGTSFVTPDMFGSYRYGSDLLNVTFDPDGRPGEFACYAVDDEGVPATREYLIRDGILLRGLGSMASQGRSGLPGVACARSCNWNRPPIDRMANLNLEPGDESLEQLIGACERGVYMRTNNSWSIDDSRNKFQFGCEWGQRIENGELKEVVKTPGYRGISATFWRSLAGVGNADTFAVMGTPNCGKGEPNQIIRVGHATPACRFTDVAVFGGA